jgi:hypothetical protein
MTASKPFRPAALPFLLLVPCALVSAATVKLDGRTYAVVKQASVDRYDIALRLRAGPAEDDPFTVRFACNRRGDAYYDLTYGPKHVELAAVEDGKRTVLAQGRAPVPPASLNRLTLRRAEELVTVIANGSVVCRAMDGRFRAGLVLVEAGDKVPRLERAILYRRAAVYFGDDFMVTQEEVDDKVDRGWRERRGTWACKSIRP